MGFLKKVFMIFLFSCFSRNLYCGQGQSIYNCYLINSPLTINGSLNKSAWQCLPQDTGFQPLHEAGALSGKQTFFQIGWDQEFLYIGMVCLEPDMDKIKSKGKDGEPLWAEDSIEIFLSLKYPDYHQ